MADTKPAFEIATVFTTVTPPATTVPAVQVVPVLVPDPAPAAAGDKK